MVSLTLRDISIPRFALRRNEAAASLGISPSLFETWVVEGKMPKPRKIKGVVLWDTYEIQDSWHRLRDGDIEDDNPFDGRSV